jgi:hypothetical protein
MAEREWQHAQTRGDRYAPVSNLIAKRMRRTVYRWWICPGEQRMAGRNDDALSRGGEYAPVSNVWQQGMTTHSLEAANTPR